MGKAGSELEHDSTSKSYVVGSSGAVAHEHQGSSVLNCGPDSRYLQDRYGRSLQLHGCSVSGLSKLPTTPNGFTHLNEGFFQHRTVDFVGRPFPLSEAHDHFSRLKQWGLTFIRLVVCWEALEHEGPGIYDMDYIDYLHSIITMMPRYGIICFIDPHQDVWSRHTGGSGAPTWTLELAGFDIRNLKATGAAHAHNLHLEPHDPPPKVWPSGYTKLAAATLATLFWGGDTFAPKRQVSRSFHKGSFGKGASTSSDKIGIQVFLQQSMIEAFAVLAEKIRDCEAVVGFEVMNEPHRGYIELHSPYAFNDKTDLAIGYFPTAVQSWALGSGHAVLIDHYGPSFPVTAVTHQVLLAPPEGRTAWATNSEGCVWRQHGLWDFDSKKGPLGEPISLRNEYFTRHPETGKEIEWYRDFYWPFCRDFGARMAQYNERWSTVVGPIPNEFCPEWPAASRPHKLIFGPHWYDLQALFSKSLDTMSANVQGLSRGMFLLKALYFGRNGLKKNYVVQIRNIIEAGYRSIGEVPVVIGETGVPFDLNNGTAFKTGDFKWQERMMDAICSALEENLVSYNLWNYNPLNDDEWGDAWNGENFSWFSLSDVTPAKLKAAAAVSEEARLNVGARVLDAVERPYACKIAGIPLSSTYDMQSRRFSFRYVNAFPRNGYEPRVPQHLARCDAPPVVGELPRARETEVYLPKRTFGPAFRQGKLRIKLANGDPEAQWKYDEERQTLYVLHTRIEPGFIHSIDVSIVGVRRAKLLDQLKSVLATLIVVFVGWSFWLALKEGRVPPFMEGWGRVEL